MRLLDTVVLGTPVGKGSMRAFKTRKGIAVTHDNPRTRPWAALVAAQAQIEWGGKPPHAGPVRVSLWFRFPRPKGHYRPLRGGEAVLRPNAPPYPTARNDVDKLARLVLDALTGIVWVDDGQVVLLEAGKCYSTPVLSPGVAIGVATEEGK